MKILLIHPQNYLQRFTTGIYSKFLRYAPLTMPTLEALIPEELNAEVRIIDEMVEKIDFSYNPDIVGITMITGTASRAYELARIFREKGGTVVFGGVHPTLNPDEALQYADAIVKGYAEKTWPELLRDFKIGKLKRVYESNGTIDRDMIVSPKRTYIKKNRYLGANTVEMSRGCPNECDFCVSHRFNQTYITRNMDDVLEEIKSIKEKLIFFLDPNLVGDKKYAKIFFTELKKYHKWWVGCASLDIVEDEELVNVMADSGCKGLLMGFESINPVALSICNKKKNVDKEYGAVVKMLHKKGIMIQGCFVFGFDCDTKSVFEQTADFIIHSGIDLPQISIYIPFPGTPLFDKLKNENRILTTNWELYNGQNVVFKPKNMTVVELEKGVQYVRDTCYSISAVLRRMLYRPFWIKPFVLLSYVGFKKYQNKIDEINKVVKNLG